MKINIACGWIAFGKLEVKYIFPWSFQFMQQVVQVIDGAK